MSPTKREYPAQLVPKANSMVRPVATPIANVVVNNLIQKSAAALSAGSRLRRWRVSAMTTIIARPMLTGTKMKWKPMVNANWMRARVSALMPASYLPGRDRPEALAGAGRRTGRGDQRPAAVTAQRSAARCAPGHRITGDTLQALPLEEAREQLVGTPPRVQHAAVRRKRAGGRVVRALVEDDGPVEAADDLLQVDLRRRPGKSDSSTDAASRGDEAGAVELGDDAACERVGDEEVFAQAASRDALAARSASQLRQDAESVVGAS